jgi:hypothetical protein
MNRAAPLVIAIGTLIGLREGTDTCVRVSNAHGSAASCEVIK